MFDTTLWQIFRRRGAIALAAYFLTGTATLCFGQLKVRWDALYDVGNLGRVSAIEVSPLDPQKIIAGGDVLGAGVTSDGGATWQQPLGFTNSQDNDITFHPTDPNIIWIGTLGGPYKSVDGGKTWALKRVGMPPVSMATISVPIERVIFDPNHSNTLIAVGGNHRHMNYGKNGITCYGAVWKSTDGGDHWIKLTTIDDPAVGGPADGTGAMINDIAFAAGSSTTLFACSDQFGVYKSIDGGSNWSKINTGLPNTQAWSIAVHPTNPNILWVALGGGGGIYKSTDGGANWTPSSNGLTDLTKSTTFRTMAIAPSNPSYLYASEWEGGGSTFRSIDGGNSWTQIVSRGSHSTLVGGTGNSGTLVFQRINVDPHDPKHVVGACEGMVVQSWDAGDSWKDTTSYPTGEGWRGTGYSGMCGTRVAWNPFRLGQVFTLGDDEGKLERSDDYLWSWKLKGSPNLRGVYNGASDVSFAADGTIYVGSGQFGNHVGVYANEPIIKSTDGGANWFYVNRPHGAVGDNRAVYVNPNNSSEVWCIAGASSTGTLYKSTDGGMNWNALELGDTGSLWNIAVDPTNHSTMYVGSRSGIYKRTDNSNFSLMQGSPTSANFEYVYVDPAGGVYAISFNSKALGGVFRFNNGVWTRIFQKAQARAMAVDPGNLKRIAVMTEGWAAFDQTQSDGIWITENGGDTWTQCIDGARMFDGPAIAFNPDKSGQLIFATNGAGFYATELGDSTPHGGNRSSIASKISASDYDDGPQGFNAPTGARKDALTGLKTGQWAKYSVNVPSSGYYNLTCKAASSTGGKFHLEFNGVNVTGPIGVKNGPAAELHIPHLLLAGGDQFMRYVPETDSVDIYSFEMSRQ